MEIIVSIGALVPLGGLIWGIFTYFHKRSDGSTSSDNQTENKTGTPVAPTQTTTASFNSAASFHTTADAPPPMLGDFFPRQDDLGNNALQAMADLLGQGGKVLIHSSGGVGKSTLAYQAAAVVAKDKKLPCYWISADGHPNFTLGTLLEKLAELLDSETNAATMVAALQNPPSLLIVDALEGIEDVTVGTFLRQLPPTCRLLTTTRNYDPDSPPGLGTVITLAPLGEEEAIKYVHTQASLSDDIASTIARAAEGVPEVMRQLIAHQTRGSLDDALKDLAAGTGDVAERVFGSTWKRLSLEAQTALCVLSIVPSMSRDELKQRTANPDVLRSLTELSDWALVYKDEPGHNWWLSGLTRSLARERLTEVHDALHKASKTRSKWNEPVALALIALTASGEMAEYLDMRGHWEKQIRWGQRALEAARELAGQRDVAAIAHHLAIAHQNRGNSTVRAWTLNGSWGTSGASPPPCTNWEG